MNFCFQNQCETLQKDLKCLTEKYDYAKVTLHSRRKEIESLQKKIDDLMKNGGRTSPPSVQNRNSTERKE